MDLIPIEQGDNWNEHWRAYADSARRNPAQQYRRNVIFSLLELGRSPIRMLDIGSGQGDLVADAATRYPGIPIVGLELSESGVAISKQKAPSATFVCCDLLGDVEAARSLEGWASDAVCSEVLEHVDDPVLLVRNAARYLAPGARLVVTVPGGPMSAFDKHIGHRTHYTPESVRNLLVSAGFEPVEVFGAGFPFFNLYRLLMVALGKALISTASASGATESVGWLARLAMLGFRAMFVLNLTRSRFGWQIVGIARKPL